MEISEKVLRELAQLKQTERTVLSAYLNLNNGWDIVKRFVDKEAKRLLPLLSHGEKDFFETSISFLFDYFKEKKAKNYQGPGLAFFADLGADYTQGIELRVAPEPLLAVDDEAIIHPLALQLDEYEPVGVIMIDASCSRIFIVAGQVVEDMDALSRKIHHLSKVGGWSQMRYQRRRDKQVKRFASDIIESAMKIFNEKEVKRILIAGRDRMITVLEQEWPKDWNDKVVAIVRWDLDAPDKDFLKKIRPVLEQTERQQERNLIGQLVAELRRGGLAVAGVKDTTKALEIGQVDILLISNGLGYKDIERFSSFAKSTAAYVEFVPKENEILAKLGGVGALLRYKMRSCY